jgi:hypothetical protein
VFANLLLLFGLGRLVLNWAAPTLPKVVFVLPPFCVLAGIYFVFVRNKRYRETVADLAKRPIECQRRVRLIGWAYIGLSFLSAFGFGVVMISRGP